MNEISNKYAELEKKRKKTVFIIIALIIFGYAFINFIFKPYFTDNGKESRLWDEQKKKTADILEKACSLKTGHPLYTKLKTECERRKRGECPFNGVNDDIYCPPNYSAEPPEAHPAF